MIEELSLWLRTLEWFPTLRTLHISGIALGLGGAIAGHIVAMRCLMHGGPSPRPGLVWSLHVLVIVGLCLLWASGTALVVSKFSFATLPPKVALKLVIATVLSLNALLMQEYLIPLGNKVSRPLVLHLSRADVIKASLIGSTSLCCWLSIAAVAFIAELHKLPLTQLFGLWLGFWAAMALGGIVLVMVRRHLGQNGPNSPKDGRSVDNSMPPVPVGLSYSVAMDRRATTATSNILALTERLKRFASASPVNDNLNQVPAHQPDQMADADRQDSSIGRDQDIDASTRPGRPGRPGARELLSSLLRREPSEQSQASAATDESAKVSSLRDVRRACRRALLGAAAVSFFVNMLMLTGPLFMLQVYDRVLTSKSVPTLTALFGLVIGLFAFMGLLDFIRSRLLVRIGLRFDRMLAGQAFASAIRVSAGGDQEHRGQLYKDVQHIRQFVSGAGTVAIFDMPWAPIYFCVIALFHWALGMVALVGAAILVALSLLNEFFSRRPVAAAVEHGARAERTFDAARRDRETLQAMGMTDRYQKRWLVEHNAEMM
ncbi:MAG: ABC transporter transmembrane domain-containing protein, partial [Pseudomonadota bacterium]